MLGRVVTECDGTLGVSGTVRGVQRSRGGLNGMRLAVGKHWSTPVDCGELLCYLQICPDHCFLKVGPRQESRAGVGVGTLLALLPL